MSHALLCKKISKVKHHTPQCLQASSKLLKPQKPYKNGNKFGVKKFNNGKCVGQIFAFGHKDKVELDALASKVLHDLHLRPGDTAKEEEIMLLAKHKVWKMLKNKHD